VSVWFCGCPCSVIVEEDTPSGRGTNALVVDVRSNAITFVMPASQGRKRVYVSVDDIPSNKLIFTYAPPRITSMTPSVVPTGGFPMAEISGESFGACNGTAGCEVVVDIVFPAYSLVADVTDMVRLTVDACLFRRSRPSRRCPLVYGNVVCCAYADFSLCRLGTGLCPLVTRMLLSFERCRLGRAAALHARLRIATSRTLTTTY
jgi:hypothetical protein